MVDVRIGAPDASREGQLQGIKPADRLEALSLLSRGGYDIVHYVGYGDFDPTLPTEACWLFADGVLTVGELGRIDRVPSLVFSNACPPAQAAGVGLAAFSASLLPTLANGFFRVGVRNYVGTAWEVNDVGAEIFAERFYIGLLGGASFAEAVLWSREALWRERKVFGALWAAYQHYGDPTSDSGLAGGA